MKALSIALVLFMIGTGFLHPYSKSQMQHYVLKEFNRQFQRDPELCSSYAEAQGLGSYEWSVQTDKRLYYVIAFPTNFYLALSFTPLNWLVSPEYVVRIEDTEDVSPSATDMQPCPQ